MAQFLKAKFLSEALKWKAEPRHAADQFFAGLRYDPFIFQQARLMFPEYNKRFPSPANKELTENFARDLNNPARNKELLKIINPEALTPEHEIANKQFETEAGIEQQQVAQMNNQPAPTPFSLTSPAAPSMPKMPVSMSNVGAGTVNAPIAETTTPETAAQTPTTTPNLPQTPLTGASAAAIPTKATVSEVRQTESAAAPASRRFNFSAFRSKTGQRIGGAVKSGLETANPYLGRAGNRLIGGLTNIVSPGGAGGAGTRSIFGRFNRGGGNGGFLSRIGRGGSGGGSLVGKAKTRGLAMFFLGIIIAMTLVGGLAISGTATTGETSPLPTPTASPTTTIAASCPVSGGTITAGSYQADQANGHCSDSYIYIESCTDSCRFTGRKSKSIDVTTGGPSGTDVVLPTIENQDVNWKLLQILCSAHGQTPPNCGSVGGETGLMYVFETIPQNPTKPKWDLQLIHMLPNSSIIQGGTYLSGTILGKTDISIVHITLGRNIADPLSSGSSSTDCDPGWLSTDCDPGWLSTDCDPGWLSTDSICQ